MKRKVYRPVYAGRKPCGCVVAASVGGLPSVLNGLTWERVAEGEEVTFDKCRCEGKEQ